PLTAVRADRFGSNPPRRRSFVPVTTGRWASAACPRKEKGRGSRCRDPRPGGGPVAAKLNRRTPGTDARQGTLNQGRNIGDGRTDVVDRTGEFTLDLGVARAVRKRADTRRRCLSEKTGRGGERENVVAAPRSGHTSAPAGRLD